MKGAIMKPHTALGCLVLVGCATPTPVEVNRTGSCTGLDIQSLARTDDIDSPMMPGALWRLAFHGSHDYRAELPVVFDINAAGRVKNAEFERASGVPISHNRHLRQSARDHLADRRYVLPDDHSDGLTRCEDLLVFQLDHPYDDDF